MVWTWHRERERELNLYMAGMRVFRLSLEFRLFMVPGGHSQELSKFGEKIFMCLCTL